jgi:exosortase
MQNLVTPQNARSTSLFAGRLSGKMIAALIFLGALWFVLLRQLSGEWSVNDQYSYGWFVPFFAAFLFWLRWEDRPEPEDRERRTEDRNGILIASAIAIAALLLLLPLRVFEIGTPEWRPLGWIHAAVVTTLTLLFIWDVGGAPWLRHFAFPVLFVFVAIPWVTPIEAPVIQGLMRAIAATAAETLNLFGIPAQLEGNLIRVSSGLVGVNEACSGVRSLQTSLMIGLLFGELKRLSISRRFILIASAVTIAIVANFGRTLFLVWVAATKNISEVSRWHDLAGYIILAVVFVGSMLLARWLAKSRYRLSVKGSPATGNREQLTVNPAATRSPRRSRAEAGHSAFVIRHSSFLAAAFCWLLIVELAAASWYRAHERNFVASARWEVQWPTSAPNFRELRIDEEVQRLLRFNQGHAASWSGLSNSAAETNGGKSKPLRCLLYFFRWDAGKNSALLANLHRPDVCLPAAGWNQVADTGVKNYPVTDTLTLPVRHFEFRRGTRDESMQQVAHAFYCLWEDRAPASSLSQMAASPSTWTRSERLRAVLDGRRHLGQQVMELVVQTRGPVDVDLIEARFAAALPELIKEE